MMEIKSDINIIDYFKDAKLFQDREFIVFELPDNYFYNIPHTKYMYFKSTNTSNNLGYDLWYYTPGIGIDKDGWDYWIVKENSSDLVSLIKYYIKYTDKKENQIVKIWNEEKDKYEKIWDEEKDTYEKILENNCVDLYEYSLSIKNKEDIFKNSWIIILLSELKSLHDEYILKLLSNKNLVDKIDNEIKKIDLNDKKDIKKINCLSRVIPTQISKIIKNISYDGSNIIVHEDIIKYKKYIMPCEIFHRYKFYHKLQLGLQLSHDIWDFLECIEHPLLNFIRNNDFDYKEHKFVKRSILLEKIKLPKEKLIIKNFLNDDEFTEYVNNVFKWKKKHYDRFKKLEYNETLMSYGGSYKKLILL